MPSAVLLLSGGIDSSTLLHVLKDEGFSVTALAVHYGQRHSRELRAARRISLHAHVPLVELDLGKTLAPIFLGAPSSQVGQLIQVPEGHYAESSMAVTVVPNRNMLLLSLAGALAASTESEVVAYAAHAGDHAIYPDCRPEFIASCARTLRLAADVTLYAPFEAMTKADIVKRGHALHVPLHLTYSCYRGRPKHCGACGTCTERREAFQLSGVPDPTEYEQ